MKHVKFALHRTRHHISKLERESIIGIIGMAIENYSVFLYGYASSVIISQFFEITSSLITFASILISYLMGPLGAIICGHIGDTLGRKQILVWTLAVVSLSSFFLSILPGYDQIGIWASIIFILLRSLQSLAAGGDMVGLVTFLLEDAPPKRRGLFGGLMSMGSAVGVLTASMVISILDPLEDPASPWKWRIPLSLSVFGLIIANYFYNIIGETETFKHYKRDHFKKSYPIIDLFRFNFIRFIQIVGITASAPIITIVIYGFVPYLSVTHLNISVKITMWSNTIALCLFAFLAPFFGALSDQIGRKPILLSVGAILFTTSIPIFILLDSSTTQSFFIIQIFFSIVTSAYYGVTFATCVEHFPTHVRYTGIALGYYVTFALFGGINGMFFVDLLIKDIHTDISPVFYLMIGSFLLFISTLFLKEAVREKLSEE